MVACIIPLAIALCFMNGRSVRSASAPIYNTESAVIGNMSLPVTLPGLLDSPTSPFYKDGARVLPSSPLYKITPVSGGYRVVIRFLSCSDEGHYVLGGNRFVVIARSNGRGVFYRYTPSTDGDVAKIYVVPADRNNPYVWRLMWNTSMSRSARPTDCCTTTSHTVTARGVDGCQMCIYKHAASDNARCSEYPATLLADEGDVDNTPRTYSSAWERALVTASKQTYENYNVRSVAVFVEHNRNDIVLPTLATLGFVRTNVRLRTASPGRKFYPPPPHHRAYV